MHNDFTARKFSAYIVLDCIHPKGVAVQTKNGQSRENQGIHGVLRYVPGLSNTQRDDVLLAQESRLQPAQVVEAARLSSQQAQLMATIRNESVSRSQAVAIGEEAALPMPDAVLAQTQALDEPADPE